MSQGVVIVDCGFGDSGKGTMTDWFCRDRAATLVVRYSGGPQCAHNVVTDDGRHHTFSQFGSGSFVGAATHLSRFTLVEPISMMREEIVLRGKGVDATITIDPGCLIITPWHKLANRIRERSRRTSKHGSVGLGIGEARGDQLADNPTFYVNEIQSSRALDYIVRIAEHKIREMSFLQDYAPTEYAEMQKIDSKVFLECCREVFTRERVQESRDVLDEHEIVVFEGAQGVLIDETHGFAPYNTWTDVTPAKAKLLALENGIQDIEVVGVLRSYFTRHGAGPFPSESYNLNFLEGESHNKTHEYMGSFRAGYFDCCLAEYAIKCCGGVDSIAMTHLDRIHTNMVADGYGPIVCDAEWLGKQSVKFVRADPFVETIEERLGFPIKYTSHGPTASSKAERKVSVHA